MTAIIIIAIVAILVLWVISVQRKLVKQEEICKNGLSQIGVQLASRWDALKALAELTKGYSEHEYKTITDTIAQRRPITAASSSAEANAQENLFNEALSRLNLVVERYPELKADGQMSRVMEELSSTENRISFARQAYNDAVTEYNTKREVFPTSIVAGIFNFAPATLLESTDSAAQREAPQVKF